MSTKPKRRVERKRAIIIDTNVSDSAETFVLHGVTDASTLIRAMADISISAIDTAMAITVLYGGLLAVEPGGTAVSNASVTQALDNNVPLQEIGRWYADVGQNDTNGWCVTDKIQFDTKAMRKLKPGDEVVWQHIASTTGDLRARGVIYLWFKE